MIRMQLTKLETLLDNLKGEESVFGLYNQGRYGELEEIHDTFQRTGLGSVRKLSSALENFSGRSVYGLYGQKGVGKSTLLSTVLLDHYRKNQIDAINYLRYNSATDNFDSIFRLAKGGARRAVTVLDDVHYSIPKFLHNVFVRGSVSFFDRFNSAMTKLNSSLKDYPSSVMIYVSDDYGFKLLRDTYFEILFAAGRSDLIRFLPTAPGKSNEINIDNEFYTRTYSIVGGNPSTYEAANRFGEVLELEYGNLLTTPRALKILIKELGDTRTEDTPIFHDLQLFGKIMRNEVSEKRHLSDYFSQKVREELIRYRDEVLTNYTSQIYNSHQKILSMAHKVTLVSKQMLDKLNYISENHPELTVTTDSFGKASSLLPDFISSATSTENALMPGVDGFLDVKNTVPEIPSESGDIDGIWYDGSKLIVDNMTTHVNQVNEGVGRLKELLHSANGLVRDVYDITNMLVGSHHNQTEFFPRVRDFDRLITAHPDMKDLYLKERKGFKETKRGYISLLSSLGSELRSLNNSLTNTSPEDLDVGITVSDISETGREIYEKRVAPLKEQLSLYANALDRPEKVKEYVDTYNRLKTQLLSVVSSRPTVFSKEDMAAIKDLVENPGGFVRKINPNTIDLIRNLSVLPY